MTWLHIAFAPKDREVRIRSDEGTVHLARFQPPHYWVAGPGILRLDDDVLAPPADVIRAVQYQEKPHVS